MARTCRAWPAGRSKLVDLLSALFGLGAWLGINAVYTQLPLLVESAPEGWQLPSIIVIVVQVSNIGVIAVWILKAVFGDSLAVSRHIYVLMSIGCISMLLLSFFYGHITTIGGESHSIALILLLCLISLGCCVSSVLYFPYMARFHEKYLVPYMVGEGLGGFVPAIISFGQGIGEEPICTGKQAVYPPPFFGVGPFLQINFAFMVVSLVAFALLDNLGTILKGRSLNAHEGVYHESVQNSVIPERVISRAAKLQNNVKADEINKTVDVGENTGLASISSAEKPAPVYGGLTPRSISTKAQCADGVDESCSVSSGETAVHAPSRTMALTLLVLQAFLCLITNAILPGIQSYTCLPYGNAVYHWSINLGSMASPLACYLAFFLPHSSVTLVAVLSSICVLTASYMMAAAVLSPFPPLMGTVAGGALVVACWVINSASVSYAKLTIATIFRTKGARGLTLYGVATQLGSAIGSVLIFMLVHFTTIFHDYNPCT